jgi:general secretion pathway protein G
MVTKENRENRGQTPFSSEPRKWGLTPRASRVGFTLIELLVVMAVVALLLTLALPRYFQSIDVSKETILIENLRVTRDAIDKFYADKGRYPESLEELVDKKYLRAMPYDPIAEASDRWLIMAPESQGGVYDIRSGAPGSARNGKPFSEL